MINKFKSLFKDEFYKNILTLASGTALAQVIPIIISPLLTRLYTPEDFGFLAVFLSIATIVSILITGRYELTILLPKENIKGLSLTILSVVLSLSISLMLFLVILLFRNNIIIVGSELGGWFYVLPLSFGLLGVSQSLNYWLNRNKKFKSIAISKVVKNVANSIVSLGLGFLKFGYSGLIFGLILGQLVSSIFLFIDSYKSSSGIFHKIRFLEIKKLAIRYKDFPKINLFSAILNSLSIELPVVLLTFYFNPVVVGFYALSQRILQAPMGLIGSSIGQVYFQKVSEQADDIESLKSTTLILYKQLIRLGALPMSILFFFAPSLFSFVFGEEWREAGNYAQVLSLWILFVFISSPLSNLLTILEKHKQSVYFNLVLLISRISSIIIGALFLESGYLTILLYGIVGALIWLVFTFYLLSLVELKIIEIIKLTFVLLLKWSSPVICVWLLIKFIYGN